MAVNLAPGESTGKGKDDKKDEKKDSTTRSRFATTYPETDKITLLVTENPKKQGSKARERFEGYTGAKTVGEALKNGVTYADIAYDVGRKFIKVGL